ATCKTGMRAARGRLVAILDADGTYVAGDLSRLLSYLPQYDQVNGARTSEQGTLRPLRSAAKWSIRKLAERISGRRIPDLNTGLKVFKRDLMLGYLWAIPDGFSFSTSMTLAFLCNGHLVKYVPVEYRKRIGHSKFRPLRDTAAYLSTVFRIIMYFRPLRVFFPLSLLIGCIAVLKAGYNLSYSPSGLHDSDIIVAFVAVMVLVVGVLADLIVAQRRGG
ncbi:MAG: glycosyltransferase, partial [Planctomycetaceae bacterium]